MTKLIGILALAACAETVQVSETPATLELGSCSHDHEAAEAEPVEAFTVVHAEPVRFEPVVVSYAAEPVELPAGDDAMGLAHCFDFEALADSLDGTKVVADDFAAGLIIGGYRPCVEGESATLSINLDPGTHSRRLATANPGRLTLHMGQWVELTVPSRCLGALSLRVAAHEAGHLRGQWKHLEGGLMAPAIASNYCSETIDSTIADFAELGLTQWSSRYAP